MTTSKTDSQSFPDRSRAMHIMDTLGMERLSWSLRRLYCPVGRDALVLDVGSGDNPYPRANVLLDGYENTIERHFAPLVSDRPIVLGSAERLPFRDNAFDFVIASHVLEHTPHPQVMIAELARVGKAGYIETPDAFFERINPYSCHRLELTEREGVIHIFKKPSARHDSEIVELYERRVKDTKFLRFISKHPRPFHMRFYWREDIPFHILNPDTDAAWPLQDAPSGEAPRLSPLREWLKRTARRLFSQGHRNRNLNLSDILACPDCRSPKIESHDGDWVCRGCARVFENRNGIPVMFPKGQEPS